MIVLGGSPDAWERQEQLIRAIAGASAYLGAKVDMPNIVDAGSTGGFFFSAMGACLEAVTYARREGVDVAAFRPFIRQALKLLPAQLDLLLDAVEEQKFGTVEATIHTFSNSLDQFRAAYADVGAPDLLLAANHRRMREAIAAGDGDHCFAALSKY
jgi:3-hydroxyisobutyrate dehydrogenase-like beta-hydroxyacid dehydrogenase